MERPLAGVRVLELASGVAGPYCGKLFADYGAAVVKVESPAGDESRRWPPFVDRDPDTRVSAVFLHLNTNKRSVVLDVSTELGALTVRELAASSDIVVESSPPGTLDRFGLGVDELHGVNPKLVVVSVTPFGSDGPYSSYRGSELVYSAIGGMNFTRADDGTPLALGGNLTQYHAGSLSAAAALAALMAVEEGADGIHVDMSIAACEAASADNTMMYLASHSYTGRVSTPAPTSTPVVTGLGALPNGVFQCSDGPVVVSTMPQWVPRMAALIADEELSGIVADPARLARPEAAGEIGQRVAAWLSRRTRHEAMTEAQAAGWAVTAVQTPAELVGDPHVASRGSVIEVDHPETGPIAHLGAPVRMTDGWALDTLAPRLGEHTEQILDELGSLAGRSRPGAAGGRK